MKGQSRRRSGADNRGRGSAGKPRKLTGTYTHRLRTHVGHRLRFADRRRHPVRVLALVDVFLIFQHRGQRCYLTQLELAERLGYGERTIRRYVAILAALRVLDVERSPAVYDETTQTWSRAPNAYSLRFAEKHGADGAKPLVAPTGQLWPQQYQSTSLIATTSVPDPPPDPPPWQTAGLTLRQWVPTLGT